MIARHSHLQAQSGQTLVILLVFITVAVMVMTAATLLSSYALTATTRSEQSAIALSVAESGMENALLRLLRDPAYTGETLTLAQGSATLTVSGVSTKTITSTGQVGSFVRTVTATASYSSGILTITSWVETF